MTEIRLSDGGRINEQAPTVYHPLGPLSPTTTGIAVNDFESTDIIYIWVKHKKEPIKCFKIRKFDDRESNDGVVAVWRCCCLALLLFEEECAGKRERWLVQDIQ